MSSGCTAAQVAAAVRAAAEVIAAHRDELVQLDRAIGDGDHGENLKRGFTAVVSKLDESTPDSPGAVLKLVATTLISTVGGAAGPLYGTAFLRAATSVGDAAELDAGSVTAALSAGLGGVVARGKAELGDKTMVDALAPRGPRRRGRGCRRSRNPCRRGGCGPSRCRIDRAIGRPQRPGLVPGRTKRRPPRPWRPVDRLAVALVRGLCRR